MTITKRIFSATLPLWLLLAITPSFLVASASAQKEPAARKDLLALRQKYTDAGTIDAQVTLEIKMPEAPAEVQKGRIVQQGEKFYVKFGGQEVTSDGKTTWLYLPDNKEVQVYDSKEAATPGGFTRPQDILDLYDSGAFDYAIVGTTKVNGKDMKQIEFKPLDRKSEYTKLRLTYDAPKREIYSMQIFNRDGSRFTLTMTSIKMGASVPASMFVFDASSRPGVRVEDMRL